MSSAPKDAILGYFVYSIINAVFVGISGVFCIIWILKYIKLSKNEECCKQRHSWIIDVVLLLVIINLSVFNFGIIGNSSQNYDMSQRLTTYITIDIAIVGFMFIIGKYFQHIYSLYFETKFTKAVRKQKWQKLINIDNESKQNWFIKNKHKWGNKSFTNKIANMFILLNNIVMLVLITLTYFAGSNIGGIVGTAFIIYIGVAFILPIVYLFVLYQRIKSFRDGFLIFKQTRYNLGCLLISVSMLLVSVLGVIPVSWGYHFIFLGFRVFALQVPMIGFIYFNTKWVINNVFPKHRRTASILQKPLNQGNTIKLEDILQNAHAIDVFMNHLMNEFSMELLISYFEFRQYEKYVNDILVLNIEDNILREFPSVPLSDIITKYENDKTLHEIDRIKHIIYDLYWKYIREQSIYQINITYRQRLSFIQLCEDKESFLNKNLTSKELYDIFTECISEMKILLGYSLARASNDVAVKDQLQKSLDNREDSFSRQKSKTPLGLKKIHSISFSLTSKSKNINAGDSPTSINSTD